MMTRFGIVLCAAALAASAQEPPPPPPEGGIAVFHTQVGPPEGAGIGGDVMFVRAELGGGGKVVKGAPYSAQVITEHTQTLADGNTIRNKQTGNFYRDSEGRTRREQPLGPIGLLPAPPMGTSPVFINDPVAGVSYVLNSSDKTAQKMPMPKFEEGAIATAPRPAFVSVKRSAHQVTNEPLGTKVIEGVSAEGTRTVVTIAAGEIGNEKPIQTVSERWYSPQLQTVVMSHSSDPRMGETIYRLTNISLTEPAAALFQVPADYTVTEGPQKGVRVLMHREFKEPPK
ncbi:MAG: hypothetical protein ACM336_19990 [Acidobacteriota bacterium]